MAALQKYLYDGDVELFYKVLFAEVSEHHYYDQMTLITALKRLLEELDLCDGVRDGLVVQDVSTSILHE